MSHDRILRLKAVLDRTGLSRLRGDNYDGRLSDNYDGR